MKYFDPDKLTPREKEVLSLAATGLSAQEIAKCMFLSKRTIDLHLYTAYPKLRVNRLLPAVLEAARRGEISVDFQPKAA